MYVQVHLTEIYIHTYYNNVRISICTKLTWLAYTCTCIQVGVYTYIYIQYTHTHAYACVCVCIYFYLNVHVYVCACMKGGRLYCPAFSAIRKEMSAFVYVKMRRYIYIYRCIQIHILYLYMTTCTYPFASMELLRTRRPEP